MAKEDYLETNEAKFATQLLTFASTPGYIDTMPFPATPPKWTYRAIYRINDTQVGQWSLPISIIVGG